MTSQDWIAVASVANTLIVLWALLYARAQVRATREGMEAQSRPYVVVDLDLSDLPLIRIFVENIGKTMARNVSITFEPDLVSTLDKEEDKRLAEIGLFSRPIPTLAPGKRFDTLFDVGFRRAKSDLSDRYEVTVSYLGDPRGRKNKVVRYSEIQVIDLNILWGLEYTTTKSLKDIHKVLDDVKKRLDSWSAGSGGLVVKNAKDLRREADERRRVWEERRLAQESSDAETEEE